MARPNRKQVFVVASLVFAGVAVGGARLFEISNERLGGRGFISLAELGVATRLPPILGRPRVRSAVRHHFGEAEVITAELLDPVTLTYNPVKVALPPHPPAAAGGAFPSTPATSIPPVQDAWWEYPVPLLAECIFSGLCCGLLCSVVLTRATNRLRHELAGCGRASLQPSVDEVETLPFDACESEPATAPTDKCSPTHPHLVKEISTDTEVSHSFVEAEVVKSYRGEFYPVEQSAPRGFSLLELVVVIAVVAALLVLLLPAIHTARLEAQTTQCATQLRQIGEALNAYANDNRGTLPAWSGWHTWPSGGSDDSAGAAWTIEMIPYLGKPGSAIYNCPAFPQPFKYRNYFLAAQWSGRSHRDCMRLSDIKLGVSFVLAGDKTQLSLYPRPFGTNQHDSDDADPDDCGTGEPVLAWPWDRGGFYMHRGGNNVLFGDMHVVRMDNFDPQRMTFNPRRVENWDDVTAD